jgi:hypothetical protein
MNDKGQRRWPGTQHPASCNCIDQGAAPERFDRFFYWDSLSNEEEVVSVVIRPRRKVFR